MGAGIIAGLFGGRGGKDSADDRESHLGDHGFSRAKGRHSSEESHSEYARNSSDRSSGSGNYNNGASSGAYDGMHSGERTFSERCKFCFNLVKDDPIVKTAWSLTISAIPIPKSWLQKVGFSTVGFDKANVSPFATVYSALDQKIYHVASKNLRPMFRTGNDVFKSLSGTSHIIRGVGRVTQVIAPVFLGSYGGARMFRCVTEDWES